MSLRVSDLLRGSAYGSLRAGRGVGSGPYTLGAPRGESLLLAVARDASGLGGRDLGTGRRPVRSGPQRPGDWALVLSNIRSPIGVTRGSDAWTGGPESPRSGVGTIQLESPVTVEIGTGEGAEPLASPRNTGTELNGVRSRLFCLLGLGEPA